jgi:hypothetical protein
MSAKLAQKRGTKKISIETRCRGGDEGRWFQQAVRPDCGAAILSSGNPPDLDDPIEHAKQALV